MKVEGGMQVLLVLFVASLVPLAFIAAGVLCIVRGHLKSAVTCFVMALLTRPNVTAGVG